LSLQELKLHSQRPGRDVHFSYRELNAGDLAVSTLAAEGAVGVGTIALGVASAAAIGYGVGTLIDMGITRAFGKSIGEGLYDLYDWLSSEENAPAYDPTRNGRRRCR
jgi:hypothetical protein